MKIFYALGYIYIAAGAAWRIACLFRKKGNCKFRRCPFRRDYTNSTSLYFPPSGCTKCLPTEEEKAVYAHSACRIVESLTQNQKKDADFLL